MNTDSLIEHELVKLSTFISDASESHEEGSRAEVKTYLYLIESAVQNIRYFIRAEEEKTA